MSVPSLTSAGNDSALGWWPRGVAAWQTARRALAGPGMGSVLLRGASSAFLVNVAGTGCGFLLQLVLARGLGAEAYGSYVYAFCWMSLCVLFGKLGLDTLTLRFVAAYQEQRDWDRLAGFLRFSRGLSGLASLVTMGGLLGLLWLLRERLGSDLASTLTAACWLLPVWVALQVHAASLTAQRRVVAAQAPHNVGRPLLLAALVLAVAAVGGGQLGARTALWLHTAAAGAMLLVMRALARAGRPDELATARPVYEWRQWLGVLGTVTLLAALEVLDEQADVLITGSLIGTKEAGVYALVSRLSLLIAFGFAAMNAIVAPLIAGLYAQRRMNELQRMVTLSAWGVLGFSLPVSLGLIVFGKWILGWFGPEFATGYLPLVVLASAHVVTAVCGPVGFLLTMTGHQHDAVRVRLLSCLAGVALNLTLIPLWGIVGAAVTMTLMTCGWKLGMLWCVWKRLGINPTALARLR